MKQTCKDCIYYYKRYDNWGNLILSSCRLNPPDYDRRFPDVKEDDWCGEFETLEEYRLKRNRNKNPPS